METALRMLAERQADPDLSLSALARAVRCSPSHLGRVFRREKDLAPMAHLARQRVSRAQHLLQHTRMGVKEIAFRVGTLDRTRCTELIDLNTRVGLMLDRLHDALDP